MQLKSGRTSERQLKSGRTSERVGRVAAWGIGPEHRAAVDSALLDAVLRSAPTLAGPAARVLSGGKRLRPAVTIAAAGRHDGDPMGMVGLSGAAGTVGLSAPAGAGGLSGPAAGGLSGPAGAGGLTPNVLAGATAVELLHWATLVHDDVIDGARSRHGQPTVNAREGVGQAIVTGDLLIGAAFELGCRVSTDTVRCLAQTLSDLCVGQTREDSHRFDLGADEDDVLAVASGKTGSLLAAAARIGGHCVGADAPVLDALSEFGMAFGISLQLLDDALDLVSSVELLGKPVGSDFVNGTITLPAVVSLRSSAELRDLVRPGLSADDAGRALELLRNPDAVRHTLRQARHHAERACAILTAVADSRFDALARWPIAYFDDQLATKVVPSFRPLLEGTRVGRRLAV
jgi:geranylgeranyl pyrophosphate synthase